MVQYACFRVIANLLLESKTPYNVTLESKTRYNLLLESKTRYNVLLESNTRYLLLQTACVRCEESVRMVHPEVFGVVLGLLGSCMDADSKYVVNSFHHLWMGEHDVDS